MALNAWTDALGSSSFRYSMYVVKDCSCHWFSSLLSFLEAFWSLRLGIEPLGMSWLRNQDWKTSHFCLSAIFESTRTSSSQLTWYCSSKITLHELALSSSSRLEWTVQNFHFCFDSTLPYSSQLGSSVQLFLTLLESALLQWSQLGWSVSETVLWSSRLAFLRVGSVQCPLQEKSVLATKKSVAKNWKSVAKLFATDFATETNRLPNNRLLNLWPILFGC